jgi:hypothetical protein
LALPPLFTTAGEESFARRSIRDRHAATLLEVIELNGVGQPYRTRLLDFRRESLGGRLTDPLAAGRAAWDPSLFEPRELADWRRAIRRQVGRSWYELPWYFAESFWFLSLLLAFGYYEPRGPNRLRDPFEPFKSRELLQSGGGLESGSSLLESGSSLLESGSSLVESGSGLGPLLPGTGGAAQEAEGAPEEEAVAKLLLASLWGNRVDLSMQSLAREYRGGFLPHQGRRSRAARHGCRAARRHPCRASPRLLLIDHSRRTARLLLASRRVDLILDNAGPELVCDLLLAARLLAGRSAGAGRRQVVLHAKRSPFYVSDARPADVEATIRALSGAAEPPVGAAGGLLGGLQAEGRLRIRDHWFWNGPRFFQDLPADLRSELGAADLVLIKGDANYRRLVGDRHWPPSTPMESLTAYFPAPLATLRTMKSEIVVDLDEAQVRRLDKEDPEWRTNGRRGLVRLVPRRGSLP